VRGIPVGIGADFQSQIPGHPDRRHLELPMPIPNSTSKCGASVCNCIITQGYLLFES